MTNKLFIHLAPYILQMSKLSGNDKIIYARIANMKDWFYDTNIEELIYLIGQSPQTIYKHLNKMVSLGLLAKKEITVKGNIQRTIYVAIFDENGERSPIEIKKALNNGANRMREHYQKSHWHKYKI